MICNQVKNMLLYVRFNHSLVNRAKKVHFLRGFGLFDNIRWEGVMKKRLLGVAVFASMVLFGCGLDKKSVDTAIAPSVTQVTGIPATKIGFAMSGDKGEFFSEAARSFRKIAGEAGVELVMQESGQNAEVQLRQIEEIANTSGIQAMVFHLVDPSIGEDIVNKYCSKFPLIFFNRSPGDKVLASCENAYFVDGDATQSGILLGLKMLQDWQKNPNYDKNKDGVIQYALVETTPDWVAGKLRGNWAVSTLKSYPDINKPVQELFRGYGGFENALGKELTKGWIADPRFADVELIIATNELNGVGVVQALDEYNLTVPLYTVDGSDNGFAAIKAGQITGGIGHDFDMEAIVSLRLAANLAHGKPTMDGISYEMFNKEILIPYIDMNPSK